MSKTEESRAVSCEQGNGGSVELTDDIRVSVGTWKEKSNEGVC